MAQLRPTVVVATPLQEEAASAPGLEASTAARAVTPVPVLTVKTVEPLGVAIPVAVVA